MLNAGAGAGTGPVGVGVGFGLQQQAGNRQAQRVPCDEVGETKSGQFRRIVINPMGMDRALGRLLLKRMGI